MVARPLLVGLMALATLPTSRLPQRGLAFDPLSSGVSVTVVAPKHVSGEAAPNVQVQIDGPGRLNGGSKGPFPKPLSDMAIQVWLLRADGNAVPQISGKPMAVILSNAGWENEVMSFSFEPVDPADLAGVVVRANGKLEVRELTGRLGG